MESSNSTTEPDDSDVVLPSGSYRPPTKPPIGILRPPSPESSSSASEQPPKLAEKKQKDSKLANSSRRKSSSLANELCDTDTISKKQEAKPAQASRRDRDRAELSRVRPAAATRGGHASVPGASPCPPPAAADGAGPLPRRPPPARSSSATSSASSSSLSSNSSKPKSTPSRKKSKRSVKALFGKRGRNQSQHQVEDFSAAAADEDDQDWDTHSKSSVQSVEELSDSSDSGLEAELASFGVSCASPQSECRRLAAPSSAVFASQRDELSDGLPVDHAAYRPPNRPPIRTLGPPPGSQSGSSGDGSSSSPR